MNYVETLLFQSMNNAMTETLQTATGAIKTASLKGRLFAGQTRLRPQSASRAIAYKMASLKLMKNAMIITHKILMDAQTVLSIMVGHAPVLPLHVHLFAGTESLP